MDLGNRLEGVRDGGEIATIISRGSHYTSPDLVDMTPYKCGIKDLKILVPEESLLTTPNSGD